MSKTNLKKIAEIREKVLQSVSPDDTMVHIPMGSLRKLVADTKVSTARKVAESLDDLKKKPGVLFIPISSAEIEDPDVGFIYNEAIEDAKNKITPMLEEE